MISRDELADAEKKAAWAQRRRDLAVAASNPGQIRRNGSRATGAWPISIQENRTEFSYVWLSPLIVIALFPQAMARRTTQLWFGPASEMPDTVLNVGKSRVDLSPEAIVRTTILRSNEG